ncbi:hypothetical protein PCAR4_660004 [Paraburkholderia caribensis]|nr:hypothetical protein PCAR4_660004 [Paraburkholderia caribensis]
MPEAAKTVSFSVGACLPLGAGERSAAGVACRRCLLARATRCKASFSASGSRGARNRSTMLAALTCSLVAPKLSTARRISSLTLMPRLSAVVEMARFWAGLTKTTMRSLGLFIDRLAFFVGVELRRNPGRVASPAWRTSNHHKTKTRRAVARGRKSGGQ